MRAAARDKDEAMFVELFRKAGKIVTHNYGPGVADLTVITPGLDVPVFVIQTIEQAMDIIALNDPIALVEVKSKYGTLTPLQKVWHTKVRGLYV